MNSLGILRKSYSEKVEEERMEVDENVMEHYANCVEELKKVRHFGKEKEEKKEVEEEEGELIVWWEREDDARLDKKWNDGEFF